MVYYIPYQVHIPTVVGYYNRTKYYYHHYHHHCYYHPLNRPHLSSLYMTYCLVWAAPKSEAGGYIFEKTIGLK